MRGVRRSIWIGSAVGLVLSASTAGAVLGAVGVVDLTHEERITSLPAGAIDYFSCPGEDALGSFHGGDRVWATGRDTDVEWVAVRSPASLDTRVWVLAEALDPDDPIEDLPVTDCSPATTTTASSAPAPAETTTTINGGGSSTTTDSAATAATGTSSTTGSVTTSTPVSTTTGSGSTTTTTPDDEAPDIAAVVAEPPRIWEDGPDCARLPREAAVAAEVTDERSAVASVMLSWSVGGSEGSVPMEMTGGGWTALVGAFAPGTIGSASAVLLTITATDASGNVGSVDDESLLTLEGCA